MALLTLYDFKRNYKQLYLENQARYLFEICCDDTTLSGYQFALVVMHAARYHGNSYWGG